MLRHTESMNQQLQGNKARIRNQEELDRVIVESLKAGLTVIDIWEMVNQRGVICYPVGIELAIERLKRLGVL